MRNTVLFLLLLLAGCQSTGPVHSDELMFVAHRGITTERLPENTIKAFRNIVDRRIEAVELDVRTTEDGYIIIMHDAGVNRTTNGSGRVDELTFREIRELDAGDGEQVPTIEETLDFFKGTNVIVLIDIKDADVIELVSEVEARDMVDQIVMGARTPNTVKQIKRLNPSVKVLAFTPNLYSTKVFVESGVDIVRVFGKWIDRRGSQLIEASSYGKPVWVTSYFPNTTELKLYPIYEVEAVITDNI